MEKLGKACFAQLDKTTAWIGIIGLVCMLFHLHTALVVIFVLLIVLPEGEFSGLFKRWTAFLRDLEDEI